MRLVELEAYIGSIGFVAKIAAAVATPEHTTVEVGRSTAHEASQLEPDDQRRFAVDPVEEEIAVDPREWSPTRAFGRPQASITRRSVILVAYSIAEAGIVRLVELIYLTRL